MNAKIVFFIIAIIINVDLCYAQKQASYWYFGTEKGLHFTPNSCVADSFMFHCYQKLNSSLNYASISDENGELLLFTEGDTLYNRYKRVVKNSNEIFPKYQNQKIFDHPIIFLPNPEYKNLYYMVSSNMEEKPGWGNAMPDDIRNGVRYSLIDINADYGGGEVLIKDSLLFFKTCDKLAACFHANGKDIWVITHDYSNTKWRTFLLTKDGFVTPPIVSTIGETIIGKDVNSSDFRTDIKISPDGKKLIHLISLYQNNELYSFDDKTGYLSDLITFGYSNISGKKNMRPLEFSPDSKKLYMVEDTILYQVDVSILDSEYITNSKVKIGIIPDSCNFLFAQLTPEGKIILYYSQIPWIGMINCPNMPGDLCNFTLNAKSIKMRNIYPAYSSIHFVQSWFKSKDPDTLKAKLWAYPPNCRDGKLGLLASCFPCAKYEWTGPNNFHSANISPSIENANPSHSGWYYCHITQCESEYYDSIQVVIFPPPEITFVSNTGYYQLCPNDSMIISTEDFYIQYKWSTGDTTESTIIRNPGKYYLTITDTNGCKKLDSIIITLHDNKINHTEEMNLGNVCVGMSAVMPDSILNLGHELVTIDSIYLINGENINLDISENIPFGLRQDTIFKYFIRTQPNKIGEFYDSLIIVMSKPCYEKIIIPIKYYSNEGSVRLSLTDIIGVPGNEHFCFPVKCRLDCKNVVPELYTLKFTIELKNDFLYYFRTTKGAILSKYYYSDKVALDIEIDSISLDENENVITNICGTLLLAGTNYTDLEVISADIIQNNIPIVIDNGSIVLTGVCAYPIRHIVTVVPTEMTINPNPVYDYLELFIKSESDSLIQTVPIEIINILGNSIMKKDIPLFTTLKVDVTELPSGVYYIKTGIFIRKFIKL